MPSSPDTVEIPPGVLAVTTFGMVTAESCQSLLDLTRHNMASNINNVHYTMVHGALVDKARNEAVKMLLGNPQLKYLFFIDADMVFAPDIMQKILFTAFHPQACPWADIIGGWCPLRGKPYLPTIDTGTGTWEPHDANVGPLEVIRTGSACILIKRHVFERMEYPWYGVRPAPRAIDMLAEIDNYARCKMDGHNPLREHAAWAILEKCASEDASRLRSEQKANLPGGFFSSVGEDSNFCDKARALGLRIVVQTDAVCGHLERQAITPTMHMAAMREGERMTRLAVGVLA